MAVTLGLSQIVKNEAHVITRMLNSIKNHVDYLTFVDTGSTDGTQDIIKEWAKENNIPCDIYEREFDNFENCRNYAMEKAKDKTDYCFWLDADEQIKFGPDFDKNKLNKDLYMFNTYIGAMKYTRNELWSNKKDFKWYGPVHEFIVPKDKSVKLSSGICPGIDVIVKMDGGSWKEETAKKYRKHAEMLENYIDNEDRDPRWVFYTAQSYHDSSCIKDNEPENKERLRRSMKYYNERVSIAGGYHEERFYAQFRIGTIFLRLERPWSECLDQLIKAYKIDPLRGEQFKVIIEYYQRESDWNMAYLYSKFAYETYHKNNPYPKRVLFIDNSLYEWRFAEFYANACFYTNRKNEAVNIHKQLLDMINKTPSLFTDEDKDRIIKNGHFFNRK
jgi:glycosyltransferase involved in cell wall biosynthesis